MFWKKTRLESMCKMHYTIISLYKIIIFNMMNEEENE